MDVNKTNATPSDNQSQRAVNRSRRAFAKLGAAATPVIMTLANRPAWGSPQRTKCTVSGFNSAAIGNNAVVFSGTVNINETCANVHAQGYWVGATPAGPTQKTATFSSVFAGAQPPGGSATTTINDVLGGGYGTFERDIVGFLLDAENGGSPLGSATQIKSIYAAVRLGGALDVYTFPSTTVTWNKANFTSYFAYLLTHHI